MLSSAFKLSAFMALIGLGTVACTTTPTETNTMVKDVDVHAVSTAGVGQKIGTIRFIDSPVGLAIQTNQTQLPPGPHGFHIHEKGSCDVAEKEGKPVAALAAGGHFNPEKAPNHGTPLNGHMGDLPILNVDSAGNAKVNLLAPRLSLADVEGLAVMVHAGGDNYSDTPKPLGGGGDRIACGVIK